MCSGRVDLSFVLRGFLKGADGVCIIGCHLGECNYVTQGNYHALSMVHLGKKLLEYIGLNSERLMIEWCSASEGARFAEVMAGFSKKLGEIGPLGIAEGINGDELKSRLEEAIRFVPLLKLAKKNKLSFRSENEEDYKKLYSKEEIETFFKTQRSKAESWWQKYWEKGKR